MRKFLAFFSFFFFLALTAYAQRDWFKMSALEDIEGFMPLDVFGHGLLISGIWAGIGFFLMQIDSIKLLGKIAVYIGALIAIATAVVFLIPIVKMIVISSLYLARYAIFIIGGLYLVFIIIKEIYEWLFTKTRR
jgi:hypothetical protein